jgi:hypothetical protein
MPGRGLTPGTLSRAAVESTSALLITEPFVRAGFFFNSQFEPDWTIVLPESVLFPV